MCTPVSSLKIEQRSNLRLFLAPDESAVPDLHDTRTKNRRRKNGVDFTRASVAKCAAKEWREKCPEVAEIGREKSPREKSERKYV